MSHAAIAAVLARDELTAGERLVAWSLSSFANLEQLAWPGNAAAAARAGLERSRYLDARERLVGRGLIELVERGCGRGHSSTIRLLFAQSGPWWDGEVNAERLEAALGYSKARGPARLLLAALAALTDETGVVEGLVTKDLRKAAGLPDSSYRRGRLALLASGEVEVDGDAGGRGRMCRWTVNRPTALAAEPAAVPRRRAAPPPGSRPLVAVARAEAGEQVDKGPNLNGVSDEKRPILSGVSGTTGPNLNGVSLRKGPILSGVLEANPAKTPPATPSPNARAGRDPWTPEPRTPPTPLKGGAATPRCSWMRATAPSAAGFGDGESRSTPRRPAPVSARRL